MRSTSVITVLTMFSAALPADEPLTNLPPNTRPVSVSTNQPPVVHVPNVDYQVGVSYDNGVTEHEYIALDIARRSVLAHYPHAGRNPMRTLQVRVRPEGDVVHTYARVTWSDSRKNPRKLYESEVFATLIYTPDLRRIYDISYRDNRLAPMRMFNRKIDLVSKLNEDFDRRDPLRMATPLVGNRQDLLVPRHPRWIRHPLGGDHAWHATSADDYIDPQWRHLESPVPTQQ